MIDVDIINCRSKKKIELYDTAIRFFYNKLLPKVNNIEINLCLENNIESDAFCTQIEPKCFIIELYKKLPITEQLKCIAHEMVHVKQFFRRELRCVGHMIIWKNQTFSAETLSRHNVTRNSYDEYINMPWEREAFLKEELLFNEFIMKNKAIQSYLGTTPLNAQGVRQDC